MQAKCTGSRFTFDDVIELDHAVEAVRMIRGEAEEAANVKEVRWS